MFEPMALAEGEELGSTILQVAQRSSPNGREHHACRISIRTARGSTVSHFTAAKIDRRRHGARSKRRDSQSGWLRWQHWPGNSISLLRPLYRPYDYGRRSLSNSYAPMGTLVTRITDDLSCFNTFRV
jgi:hypothetical protein